MAMYEDIIEPRFSETDALGHISNTALPVWFEGCRAEFFKLVHPSMSFTDWPVILAKFEIDFNAQLFIGTPITIKTGIEKVGNSSIVFYQEAWQNETLANVGRTVMVWIDHKTQSSCPIPNDIKDKLATIMVE